MKIFFPVFFLFLLFPDDSPNGSFNVNSNLDYCVKQATKTAATLPVSFDSLPRSIASGTTAWHLINYRDWCSGFWPGIMWYAYEYTKDTAWKNKADQFSRALAPLAFNHGFDHDLGFQLYNSFGNGFRLTGDTSYKRILIAAADSLSTLFNVKTGTILSWPHEVRNFGGHNTIVDNMMNLELLFWAANNGGDHRLFDIAVKHAETTMKNHFRPDHSAYHVLVYDTITGQPIKKVTRQGYSDSSMWARGQAWAIYGFTMVYRETKDKKFLDFAEKIADKYLQDLPADLIPYWDFNAPDIPKAPRDASAATITASALLELSTLIPVKDKAADYRSKAEKMLENLSLEKYQSRNVNSAFLLHSTGHKPAGGEVDASIIYADYYYMEALLRLKKLREGKLLTQNL